jgi:DNA ligase (NAD+)
MDIYRLDRFREEIVSMEGFGADSFNSLWNAIQASRDTTFERYLISMDIPMIGRTHSGILCKEYSGSLDAFEAAVESGFNFADLPGFGGKRHQNIYEWFKDKENRLLWKELQKFMNIQNPAETTSNPAASAVSGDSVFAGKVIVATGKMETFASRGAINAKFASLGAIAGDTVTKKTDYVVYGGKPGSKLDKARAMGATVLSEQKFLEMIGDA